MRRIAVVLAALLAGFWPAAAFAQEIGVGERIVTIRKADLRSGNDTTGTVPGGNILEVKYVNGDWFWVAWTMHKTVKGWISRSDVIPFSQAEDYFEEQLRRNPNAEGYNTRGMIRLGKGDLDLAVADFTEAIRLNPKFAVAYDNRGVAWGREKEYAKSIADYSAAIRIDPKLVNAWNDRAWEEATAQEDRARNGKKAVADAKRALELAGSDDDPTMFATLAAAYAEAGDFTNAVKWQSRAVQLAPSAAQKADWQARLELYRNRQAYRDN
jgi:tetratricopeptide (TPR) repeat protein